MTSTQEQIDAIFAVNLKAVINVTQVIAEGMVARGNGGSIVNVSSNSTKCTATSLFAYSLSKVALDHTTRMFAVELGKHKIRVNSINPTLVPSTDMGRDFASPEVVQFVKAMTPLGDTPQVQDVTNAVLYLLSDKSNFITGETLSIDGGFAAK